MGMGQTLLDYHKSLKYNVEGAGLYVWLLTGKSVIHG